MRSPPPEAEDTTREGDRDRPRQCSLRARISRSKQRADPGADAANGAKRFRARGWYIRRLRRHGEPIDPKRSWLSEPHHYRSQPNRRAKVEPGDEPLRAVTGVPRAVCFAVVQLLRHAGARSSIVARLSTTRTLAGDVERAGRTGRKRTRATDIPGRARALSARSRRRVSRACPVVLRA